MFNLADYLYRQTLNGLPLMTNGGSVIINWNNYPNKIFAIPTISDLKNEVKKMSTKKVGRPPSGAAKKVTKVDRLFADLVDHFDENQTQTGNAIGWSQSTVWAHLTRSGKKTIAPMVALRADMVTNGKFSCEELCPEIGTLVGAINHRRESAGKARIGEQL